VKKATAYLTLLMLLAVCFSTATLLQPRVGKWGERSEGDNLFKILLGDGRRLFAEHYFTKADVYFHSGYYPTIFDRRPGPKDNRHMSEEEHGSHEEEHEKEMDFLGQPKDWVERFGRHFIVSEHTHLSGGKEREMLPWLKLSAELDPNRVDTYTVAAFWLRKHLGNVAEAEKFLREGLRANPNSYEILFALGSLYSENLQETNRARNVWELALRKWNEQAQQGKKPDNFALEEITVNLAHLEEDQGNLRLAISYLEQAKQVSPSPVSLDIQIQELKKRLSPTSSPPAAPP
jgi:tetratricopeptide (TPR) repeat protein